jgi:hypothetical protein
VKKSLKLPPEVARGFSTMNDYFAEANPIKPDAIAAHQLSVLVQCQGPRERLRLDDVKA